MKRMLIDATGCAIFALVTFSAMLIFLLIADPLADMPEHQETVQIQAAETEPKVELIPKTVSSVETEENTQEDAEQDQTETKQEAETSEITAVSEQYSAQPINAVTPPVVVSADEQEKTISLYVPQDKASNTGMKAWMDYRAITSPSSIQYQLQQSAVTDPETGIRMYDNCYMVALGTYYSQKAGEKFRITLENGFVFNAITGDIKANRDTDSLNQHRNGNIVEFVVDKKVIPDLCRKMGDMSWLNKNFAGKIMRIEKIIES